MEPVTWVKASEKAAHAHQKGKHVARKLRKWLWSFIESCSELPVNLYGTWNTCLLEKGDLAKEIHEHLQGIGKCIRAEDIIHFLDQPEIRQKHSLKKTISVTTAQHWMAMMDFRWTKTPLGQYIDGHEREDIEAGDRPVQEQERVIIWFHDESTFYANDHCKVYWVHKDETAKPRAKGEGASLMVADFISADYGWLRSACGQDATHILFKAGKAHDGYFTNDDILRHTKIAMEVLEKHFPNERHIFIFDNATMHLKRADDALSACQMPKYPNKPGKPNFGVNRNIIDVDGKPVYGTDGKILKERVKMSDGKLPSRGPQSFYFRPDDPRGLEGNFKGMVIILEERGFKDMDKVRAKCKGFKCPKDTPRCCCRRVLFNQPDFVNVQSCLEDFCNSRGIQVVFLPKFHCELNFIEQC
ncbi:hypothetical protein PAXRUDRAFT_169730 [Paxillus rubicundulus Ve08.2h10]|uniref:Unplaced genomic scaffold scaffold_2627, whole genome shotgun sequence n=1 Tax=Paxillus rubicundulus Ve08.2h10 TaxID=930991 RepID=A0A0D0DFI6_9AGAM|nr:hypothetical protein PAXRUDRAFT_169730 [Paxillus rubicundulus Ve08.2h10]